MTTEEGFFEAKDGVKLFFKVYRQPSPRYWMLILHGHGEYAGRYEKFADILKDEEISLACYDTRGAGRSEGTEVYVDSYEDFLSDLTAFRGFLRLRWGVEEKIALFGHSMGGLTALHWALRNPEQLRSLILSSPCLGLRLPRHLHLLNNALNQIMPKFAYANPVYPPYLSHSAEEVEKYRKDPFVRRKISVRLLAEMINYTAKLRSVDKFVFSFPVYVLMAGQEKVVDPAAARSIFDKIEAPQKYLQSFDTYYHEIFNELGQEKAFEALKHCLRDSLKYSEK